MKPQFNTLSKDIQKEIVRHLFYYSDCHIEHANGVSSVQVSYMLKSKYADDEWISGEYTKEEFGIKFDGNYAWEKAWTSLENQHRKSWENIDSESKKKCYKEFEEFIDRKAEEEVERILND